MTRCDVSKRLLAELAALAVQLAPSEASDEPFTVRRLAAASGFGTRRVVYSGAFAVEMPLVVAVLEGRKDLVLAGELYVAERGDVIIFPPRTPVETTCSPDMRSGHFRSFVVEVDPEVSIALSARHPALCKHPQTGAFPAASLHVLRAEAGALQAVLHYARTLLLDEPHPLLVRHRLEDLLLSLSLQYEADRSRMKRADLRAGGDLVLAVRQLVRLNPESDLTADEIAHKLAVSPATLRRRLAEASVSLRTLRAEERMALARALLAKPGAQVADVAMRCGYRSPSKFARQFRRYAGDAPRRRAV